MDGSSGRVPSRDSYPGGLPPDSSAVKSVIEPAQDGTWVLRMRSMQASVSGVPSQWAFSTAAGREASLGIHTAPVREFERSVEEDEGRLRRQVRLFDRQGGRRPGATTAGRRQTRRAARGRRLVRREHQHREQASSDSVSSHWRPKLDRMVGQRRSGHRGSERRRFSGSYSPDLSCELALRAWAKLRYVTACEGET
jgi:hypothetical protein